MDNFNQIIEKLNQDYHTTVQNGVGEAYSRFSTIFEELNGYLREYIQEQTDQKIRSVLRKLKDGDSLSQDDIDVIRLWIVDDAEQYCRLENNFKDWQEELKRLVQEISAYKDRPADIQTASELRALFLDGTRVLADIFFYIQQKDRVSKFAQASQQLGPQDRALLIGLLEQKISATNF